MGLNMPAIQEIDNANRIISKIDEFPDYTSQICDHIQDHEFLLRKLELAVKIVSDRLDLAYEITSDFIEKAKEHGVVDTEQPLVGCVNDYEKYCSKLYEYFNKTSPDSFHYPHIIINLKEILKVNAGKFQDLRWNVLIHNGRLAPRSNKTFSGGDEFETIVNRRD